MAFEFIPQATGVGADGTDQNVMAALAARRLAMARGQGGGALGLPQRGEGFAPTSNKSAALGYGAVMGRALLDRIGENRDKAAQTAAADKMAEALRPLGGPFANMTGAHVLAGMIMNPAMMTKLAEQAGEAAFRKPDHVTIGPGQTAVSVGGGQFAIGGGAPPAQPGPQAAGAPAMPGPQVGAAPVGPMQSAPLQPPAGAQQGPQAPGGRVIASQPPESENMRKEVQDRPSFKNYSQAAPVFQSMKDAVTRDDRASDVNLIYGMAKLMDPGSVVRESEMTVAQAIATLPQQLRSQVMSQMTATGRLDRDVRIGIMNEAYSRMNAYEKGYAGDQDYYSGLAQRKGIAPGDVVQPFEFSMPYNPATAPGPNGEPPMPPQRPPEMGPPPGAQASQPAPAPAPQPPGGPGGPPPQMPAPTGPDPMLLQEAIRRGLIKPPEPPQPLPNLQSETPTFGWGM